MRIVRAQNCYYEIVLRRRSAPAKVLAKGSLCFSRGGSVLANFNRLQDRTWRMRVPTLVTPDMLAINPAWQLPYCSGLRSGESALDGRTWCGYCAEGTAVMARGRAFPKQAQQSRSDETVRFHPDREAYLSRKPYAQSSCCTRAIICASRLRSHSPRKIVELALVSCWPRP